MHHIISGKEIQLLLLPGDALRINSFLLDSYMFPPEEALVPPVEQLSRRSVVLSVRSRESLTLGIDRPRRRRLTLVGTSERRR